ncbi:MAG: hypothetical protein IJ104_06380 [Methanobrevibacter sp.]|uniref:hypothetical protein n=1 Tax=Methanobrevibacter sp. TaxID=66852 RepID=UPI0025EE695B|nr:hypothetical protein [Methanobrevibacter sp.]MBQ8017287.1 hypothetical protein [Methanobrevibacter sp.]MBQ9025981.1 hypothetical protein [Methanobrevibacter sp.]
MKQKWKEMQFVEISMHEIFCLQDLLDSVKDDPEKVWEIFDDFLMDCENQLELDPGFLKELMEIDLEKDSININNSEDFDKLFEEDTHYKTAKDYVDYIIKRSV